MPVEAPSVGAVSALAVAYDRWRMREAKWPGPTGTADGVAPSAEMRMSRATRT